MCFNFSERKKNHWSRSNLEHDAINYNSLSLEGTKNIKNIAFAYIFMTVNDERIKLNPKFPPFFLSNKLFHSCV